MCECVNFFFCLFKCVVTYVEAFLRSFFVFVIKFQGLQTYEISINQSMRSNMITSFVDDDDELGKHIVSILYLFMML